MTQSELEPHSEIDLPGQVLVGRIAELRTRKIADRRGEIDAVEEIKDLAAQLKLGFSREPRQTPSLHSVEINVG